MNKLFNKLYKNRRELLAITCLFIAIFSHSEELLFHKKDIIKQSESVIIEQIVLLLKLMITQILLIKIATFWYLIDYDKNDINCNRDQFYLSINSDDYAVALMLNIKFVYLMMFIWSLFSDWYYCGNAEKLGIYSNILRVLMVLYPASVAYSIYQFETAAYNLIRKQRLFNNPTNDQ